MKRRREPVVPYEAFLQSRHPRSVAVVPRTADALTQFIADGGQDVLLYVIFAQLDEVDFYTKLALLSRGWRTYVLTYARQRYLRPALTKLLVMFHKKLCITQHVPGQQRQAFYRAYKAVSSERRDQKYVLRFHDGGRIEVPVPYHPDSAITDKSSIVFCDVTPFVPRVQCAKCNTYSERIVFLGMRLTRKHPNDGELQALNVTIDPLTGLVYIADVVVGDPQWKDHTSVKIPSGLTDVNMLVPLHTVICIGNIYAHRSLQKYFTPTLRARIPTPRARSSEVITAGCNLL